MINPRAAAHIAQLWHGGGSSPLYQFASTGTITKKAWLEVHDNINNELGEYLDFEEKEQIEHVKELTKLLEFLVTTGERGPVDGWYETVIAQGRG